MLKYEPFKNTVKTIHIDVKIATPLFVFGAGLRRTQQEKGGEDSHRNV